MINLKWSRRHDISWGDNGKRQDFRNRKSSEVVEKNGESSKKVTSAGIKYR